MLTLLYTLLALVSPRKRYAGVYDSAGRLIGKTEWRASQ